MFGRQKSHVRVEDRQEPKYNARGSEGEGDPRQNITLAHVPGISYFSQPVFIKLGRMINFPVFFPVFAHFLSVFVGFNRFPTILVRFVHAFRFRGGRKVKFANLEPRTPRISSLKINSNDDEILAKFHFLPNILFAIEPSQKFLRKNQNPSQKSKMKNFSYLSLPVPVICLGIQKLWLLSKMQNHRSYLIFERDFVFLRMRRSFQFSRPKLVKLI